VRTSVAVLLIVEIAVSWPVWAEERVDGTKARTLSQAIDLAGPRAAALPIALAARPYAAASSGVEAWTLYGEDGRPQQIFVYTESVAFRCANRQPKPDWQCRLKLASVIVHEAWHFNESRDEAGAYVAQLAFLIGNGASPQVTAGVRRSRDRAVAARGANTRQRGVERQTPR
jgi:hypothetical protein